MIPHPLTLVARLTTGEILTPGTYSLGEHGLGCPGPDREGRCSLALVGATPLCEGATWYAREAASGHWRLRQPAEAAASTFSRCPVVALDPEQRLVPREPGRAELFLACAQRRARIRRTEPDLTADSGAKV